MNILKCFRPWLQSRLSKVMFSIHWVHLKKNSLFAIIFTILCPINVLADEVIAVADTYVNSGNPNHVYGGASVLRANNSNTLTTYLRFDVTASALENAEIHIFVESGSASVRVHPVSNTSWDESTLTFNNAPVYGAQIGNAVAPNGVDWIKLDVSSVITTPGTYSFALKTTGSQVRMSSKEGANAPRLVFKTPIKLPIEVLGNPTPNNIVEESITFEIGNSDIANPNEIKKLRILAHRIGFLHWHSPKANDAKAAVIINNGTPIEITNSNSRVVVRGPARHYGKIGGGFMTMTLDINVNSEPFNMGTNTLTFRFLESDGISSGFRIIELNFLDSSKKKLLPQTRFLTEDPATRDMDLIANSNSANGEVLWKTASLTDPQWGSITASCSDCHTYDGRDLKYYHYSNKSIIERSKFHGLSEQQGQDIAAYIRTLNIGVPDNIPNARPWNPPYQPGTSLSNAKLNNGTTFWAAGAGVKSVLNRDSKMLTKIENLGSWDSITSTWSTLNVRKIPIAIQFPDWNAWLPAIHPMDIWDLQAPGSYQDGYNSFRTYLETNAANNHTYTPQDDEDMFEKFKDIDDKVRNFVSTGRTGYLGGGNWRTMTSSNIAENIGPNMIHREQAKLALAKWMAVKSWELVHEFDLEHLPEILRPDAEIVRLDSINGTVERGEFRGWPSLGQSTWAPAPHMTSDPLDSSGTKRTPLVFINQNEIVGHYESSVWYHLQMTLNAGARKPTDTTPIDWSYHFLYLNNLHFAGAQPQSLRYVISMIKAMQARHMTEVGPGQVGGWQMRFLHPWLYYSRSNKDTDLFDELDNYRPGLRKTILESMLKSFMDVVRNDDRFSLDLNRPYHYDNNPHQRWPRPIDGGGASGLYNRYRLENGNYSPNTGSFVAHNHANSFYTLIPLLKSIGNIDPNLIQELTDWCKEAWPNGDWDNL